MGVIWWTDKEKEILKNIYPAADKNEILKVLKNKTWYACRKEAKILGLQHTVIKSGRPKKPPKQNLGKNQLLKLTEEYPDITVEELAAKLRSTPDIVRRYLHKYNI